MSIRMTFLFAVLLLPCHVAAQRPFFDRTHQSQVFGEPRNYRIFLPSDYASGKQAYPVIYYFHGHSDRYTLERYDNGVDTVPKIAAFVAGRPVIVVAVDGYVARDYTGFYGGAPWDVMAPGGGYDFGAYFRELVAHIDSAYRTLTSRRARAVSGLSMGGFMSLYLSARFPDLIGSASSFNPGPEFYVGAKGRRVLWRPKDHVGNHSRTMVRLMEWTSAKERTSVIRLAADTPPGARIPLLLDNESWSYTWTPDVRYGTERLYQAFQLHRRHLYRYELVVAGKSATSARKP